MVVVLPGVAGAFTTTVMVCVIEPDVPVPGTRVGRTLVIVQAPFVLELENVKYAGYAASV